MKKVSIIVPVYNTESYLEKCLDSLVNQTLEDIEIIVVNDGSPDNSQEIIDKYAKEYKNIKSYIKENGGLSDTRNYGIKKATGKYIAFIDSDDYISLEMMEKMYSYAENNHLDIVTCNSIKVYPNSNNFVVLPGSYNYTDNPVKKYLTSHPMACTRIYNRNLFKEIEFKKGIYYEDLELIPKLIKYTKKVGFLNENLYYYLQRDGSIMYQKEFNNKLLDIFDVLESNKKVLIKDYYEEIEYMYITHLLRTATLRFLDYKEGIKYNLKINNIIKNEFPNWRKNIYYKKSSYKLKLICFLAYNKQYKILKILKNIVK